MEDLYLDAEVEEGVDLSAAWLEERKVEERSVL